MMMPDANTNPNSDVPLLEVLHTRRINGSRPGFRSDNFRVGLAVEGGGMRGIVSGAMLSALRDIGFADSFDDIYASSAGAINGAYFMAGDGFSALSVYYDELIGAQFVNPINILRQKPLVSLDYLFDDVMEKRYPLPYRKVLDSKVRLHIAVTSVRDVRTYQMNSFATGQQLKSVLRASAAMPIAAGGPIDLDGEPTLDGTVLLAHPAIAALEGRCTHIVVLRTRANPFPLERSKPLDFFIARYLERLQPGLGTGYLATGKKYAELHRLLTASQVEGHGGKGLLDVHCAQDSHTVSRLCRDRGRLIQGMRAGYAAVLRAFNQDASKIYIRPVSNLLFD